MKKVALILSPGFEEVEAITPIDILRRAGLEVVTFGLNGREITGSHNISVKCDDILENLNDNFDALVIPGGMPGARNISENKTAMDIVKKYLLNNKIVGAICASPGVVLGKLGVLEGKNYTCYPGFNQGVKGNFSEDRVVVDGNLITSRGLGTALEFSFKLVDILVSKEVSNKLKKGSLFHS